MSNIISKKDYSIHDIKTHKGLEIILSKPSMYIPDREILGLVQLAIEITDNCIDEIQLLRDAGELTIIFCNDVINNTYHYIIYDNGRGIPVENTPIGKSKFVDILTEPHTSGKFTQSSIDETAYENAIGQLGVGSKVTAGLSEYFTAISRKKTVIAKLNVHNGKHEEPYVLSETNTLTGTYIAFTPNKNIFTGVETYVVEGYPLLVERIKKYCIFKNFNIKFYIHEGSLDLNLYKTKNPNEALSIIDNTLKASTLDWDSTTFDSSIWLRKHWRIKEPYTFYHEDKTVIKKDNLGLIEFRLGYICTEKTGGVVGIINNQHIDNSDHVVVFLDILKQHIGKNIIDKDKLRFFLKNYRFPVFVAIDVEYSGAEFTSAIKDKFKSSQFRIVYSEALNNWFNKLTNSFIKDLFESLSPNIDESYLESLKATSSNKNRNRLSGLLHFPTKFKDCECKDTTIIELFLTEGDSAGGAIGYDKSTKASYMLKGKPKNCVKGVSDLASAIKNVYSNKIYSDILTIIGYDLTKPDLSKLNFSKIILMVDADTHGAHIASLILGTFQLVAPELIEAGIFYKALPPFYRILKKSGNKVSKTNAIYANSLEEVIDWKSKNLYYSRLAIRITNASGKLVVDCNNTDNYSQMIIKIEELGQAIENVSKELSVDPEIFESFCNCDRNITIDNVDFLKLADILQVSSVKYDSEYNQLTISDEYKDSIVTLPIIIEKLHSDIFPLYKSLEWGNWYISVTTLKDTKFNNTKLGIYSVYKQLIRLSNSVKVDVLKGLGSMSQEDIATTCMNDNTRSIQKVCLADNKKTVFELLGNDSDVRKDLLPQLRSTIA